MTVVGAPLRGRAAHPGRPGRLRHRGLPRGGRGGPAGRGRGRLPRGRLRRPLRRLAAGGAHRRRAHGPGDRRAGDPGGPVGLQPPAPADREGRHARTRARRCGCSRARPSPSTTCARDGSGARPCRRPPTGSWAGSPSSSRCCVARSRRRSPRPGSPPSEPPSSSRPPSAEPFPGYPGDHGRAVHLTNAREVLHAPLIFGADPARRSQNERTALSLLRMQRKRRSFHVPPACERFEVPEHLEVLTCAKRT